MDCGGTIRAGLIPGGVSSIGPDWREARPCGWGSATAFATELCGTGRYEPERRWYLMLKNAGKSGLIGMCRNGRVRLFPGFTYAGYALKDCIKGALPYVEVHISNIAKRNIHCVLSDVAEGMITGFGMHSYILGLDAMLEILRRRANAPRPV
jgi:dehydroquinase class II